MSDGSPFNWGLTPGEEPSPEPTPVAKPADPAAPAYLPPLEQSAGPSPFDPAPEPPARPAPPPVAPADPFAQIFPEPVLNQPAPPAFNPPPAMPTFEPPAPSVPPIDSVSLETQLWDTVAAPAAPPASALPSTTQTTPLPADLDDWWSTSTDPRTGGAAPVPPSPERSDNPPTTQLDPGSGIDALFGETQFQDFSDEPMIAPLPPRDAEGRIREPRPPIPKTLKTLMWIAGGLLAALLLVALFAIGTRMAPLLAPAAPPTPTPTGAAPIPVGAIGPVAAGNHDWNDLLGGECLASFESAWQASYQVVDCTQPHAAQMVFRGTFDYLPDVPYPGTQELLSKANLACSASTVIDYAAANVYKDVQVSASFAADQSEWDDGNHSFLCYVSRSSGETFTTSIAMPPVAITAAPTATPTPAVSPSATAAK